MLVFLLCLRKMQLVKPTAPAPNVVVLSLQVANLVVTQPRNLDFKTGKKKKESGSWF